MNPDDKDFALVRHALMLLDGQPHDAMEVHEGWLGGLAALEAIAEELAELRALREQVVGFQLNPTIQELITAASAAAWAHNDEATVRRLLDALKKIEEEEDAT